MVFPCKDNQCREQCKTKGEVFALIGAAAMPQRTGHYGGRGEERKRERGEERGRGPLAFARRGGRKARKRRGKGAKKGRDPLAFAGREGKARKGRGREEERKREREKGKGGERQGTEEGAEGREESRNICKMSVKLV